MARRCRLITTTFILFTAPGLAQAAGDAGNLVEYSVYGILLLAGIVVGMGIASKRAATTAYDRAAGIIMGMLSGSRPDLTSVTSHRLKRALESAYDSLETPGKDDPPPESGPPDLSAVIEERDKLRKTVSRQQQDLERSRVLIDQLNGELVTAIQSRADFIERMGREIKVPLNTIIGLTDIMGRSVSEPLTERQYEHAGRISERAFDIIGVVNDFTEFLSLDDGVTLNIEDVDLSHLCRRCIESLEPMARAKGVTVVQETSNLVLRADHNRLRFVLHDLIHNAIKFNREGGLVTVTAGTAKPASLQLDGEACTTVVIRVEDTGEGISRTDIDRLFKPFSQLPDEHGMKPRGSGLSLYLVRKFVELHGGRIDVDSRRGQGSTFTVTLPCSVTGISSEPSQTHKKVLVVEDDPAQMNLVMRCLESEPLDLYGAEDGVEALQKVVEVKPDLILMDVVMPKLDGISVCKTLKKDERYSGIRHVPIIIMTSMEDPSYRIDGAKAGADEFLSKPLDISLLKERVRSLLTGKERFDRMIESYRTKEREAKTDPLTGLYNRRSMEVMLPELFRDSTSNQIGLCVLMMDLDHFKRYNDTRGHQAGDELLRKAASIFRHEVRDVDLVARYGGEEFLVLLPGTPPELALSVANRIRESVLEGTGCTISIGVSSFPKDSGTPHGLIACADKALYAAKEAGRDRVVIYSDLD